MLGECFIAVTLGFVEPVYSMYLLCSILSDICYTPYGRLHFN